MVQMINQFSNSLEKNIEGSGDNVSMKELSGGARIARIFHERFPFEIVKMELDERTLRKEIAYAIKNIHGIRVGLFTPDEAFEAVVKNLIEKLKLPCLKCVDLVAAELNEVVNLISDGMSRFPKLREETERLVHAYVREVEMRAKEHVKLVIDIELSYMNTNHPDFIGFANASQRQQKTNAAVGNQVVRKGWLRISSEGLVGALKNKEFWFVLSAETLSWFKDDEEKELKFQLPLDGLKLQVAEDTGLMKRKNTFVLIHPDPRKNIYKDHRTLDLTAASPEEMESWQASFLRAGVYPVHMEEEPQEDTSSSIGSVDPQLERQVETIRNLVDSYMQISAYIVLLSCFFFFLYWPIPLSLERVYIHPSIYIYIYISLMHCVMKGIIFLLSPIKSSFHVVALSLLRQWYSHFIFFYPSPAFPFLFPPPLLCSNEDTQGSDS